MNEGTEEREGLQEAPEQPEPPRVRNGAAGQKITLPADADLARLVHETPPEILTAVAADPRLSEDLALAMLNRRDLPRETLEALSKNARLAKVRNVRLALVSHPQTPRHVSIPAIRNIYTCELMQVALLPAAAPDVKRAAEEVLIGRLGSIASGERLTLARQGSGRIAAALLVD